MCGRICENAISGGYCKPDEPCHADVLLEVANA
jgi:hypothetical protein